MLFDAHTHLNFEEYTDEERAGLAEEIEASEVGYIIDVGDCAASARQALADAAAYTWCYAAVGIHPDRASAYRALSADAPAAESKSQDDPDQAAAYKSQDDLDQTAASKSQEGPDQAAASKSQDDPRGINLALLDADIDEIRRLASHPKAVAIGEIGLDYYYGTDDREEQQEVFRRQIRLANELRMPIMIHSRDAHRLTLDILIEEGAFSEERKSFFPERPAAGAMAPEAYRRDIKIEGEHDGLVPDARVQMHCFSGSPELAEEYVRLGATISLGGPITFKNGKKAAETARQIPIEFLLSETDAPYMAPEPLRGRPNKSPYIEHIVRRMAILKGIGYDDAARILSENGKRFFGIGQNI